MVRNSSHHPPLDLEGLPPIKVIGVGGGGSNSVDRMIQERLYGVEFVAVNTDAQALARSQAPMRIRIGDKLTKGLGVGGDPTIGTRAAEESHDELNEAVRGAEMVCITAGMGGGTGTGAAPVVAELARQAGALTVAVVTKPFGFEGAKRRRQAEEGIERLQDKVDTLIVIPNDRLLSICDQRVTFAQAFHEADGVLHQGIRGISELITRPGLINLDFADVKKIMQAAGPALLAIGRGQGENRAVEAAKQAISSPLLDASIQGARGVLFNVTGPEDLLLFEVNMAAQVINEVVDPDAEIIFGAVLDDALGEEVQITVIATGFEPDPEPMQQQPRRQAAPQPSYYQFPPEQRTQRQAMPSEPPPGNNTEELPAFLRRTMTSRGS
jgi:cell division protein FtsZ